MDENWKYHPDCEKYIISDKGKVKSLHRKKPQILKQSIDLYINGKRTRWQISKLVFHVFGKLNQSHKGSEHPQAKLNETKVKIIRDLFKRGDLTSETVTMRIDEFLKILNIHQRTLKSVLNYETWRKK